MAVSTPVEIFCSYAHEDEAWRQKLETHLSLLKRQGLISLWHDRLITAGTDWAHALDQYLETASVILLLVSADFLASDYCYSIEMKRALERQEAGEALVIPILVRQVDWKDAPFAHLHALPTDAQPLASWQDVDMALADVTAGIRRAIENMPQLSAKAPRVVLPSIWNVPYQRNPFFTGREKLLSRVHAQLQGGQPMAVSQHPQAISGLGGIGKTQIAVEYAYRFYREYEAVLWAQAESREALISSYVALAALLNLSEQNAQEHTITVQAVKRWLHIHSKWLLILDNADELALARDFLPPALGGHLLLTTRAQAMGGLAKRIEVETFSAEQGTLFLLRRAGLLEQASADDRERAAQITMTLGGLPLALDQAGAYIEETVCSLADYQQLYQHHQAKLLKERRGPAADHPSSVATTVSLAVQRVEQTHPAAAELLRFCAFLSPDAIAEEIIGKGAPHLGPLLSTVAADPFLLNQAMEVLLASSLVQRDPGHKNLSIHRLVQAVLRDAMGPETAQQWTARAVQAVNAAFPEVEFPQWSDCERCLPHALICITWIEHGNIPVPEAVRLLTQAGLYLKERALYTEAESPLQQALTICEQQLGAQHPNTAASLHNLAWLCEKQGKYAEAESLLQRALAIREQQLGAQHPDTAASLHRLARLSLWQGEDAEAESLLQRALAIREQQLGAQHPDTAASLHELALIYASQGKSSEAESLYRRALAIRERQLGAQHPDTAASLFSMAYFYTRQGKDAEAEPLLQRALAIDEKALGPEHPLTANCLGELARLYARQGKDAEAEPLLQRALAIDEKALGPEHLRTAGRLNSLAWLYTRRGKYEQAEPLFQRALRIWEQAQELEHLDRAICLENLAELYRAQGKYEQAEPLYQRALSIREQALGPEHPDVAICLENLAELYYLQSKYEQAEPLYHSALHIWEQASGPAHPDTAICLNGLANLYSAQGKYEQAEPLFQRALRIWEQVQGPVHPDVASALIELADLYSKQGKYEQAESLYGRALTIREQMLEPEHPNVASDPNDAAAYLARGYVYLHLKKSEEACADFARCATLQPGNVNAAWMVVYAALGKRRPGRDISERLEEIAKLDPLCHEACICRGVALGLCGKPQEGLAELERALDLHAESEDAWFWKGMMYAYLSQSTVAVESIEQALQAGLPPILLTPLFWLEQERPQFYQEYAEPLLRQYGLL